MKITLRARVRAFLAKRGRATIDAVVAALGKHVTATQALRAYDRVSGSTHRRGGYSTKKKVTQARKVEIGTRIVLTNTLTSCRKVAPSYLRIRSLTMEQFLAAVAQSLRSLGLDDASADSEAVCVRGIRFEVWEHRKSFRFCGRIYRSGNVL